MTWWRGDALPELPRISGLSVGRCCDDAEMALLQGSMDGVVAARCAAGNVPYVARINGEPAAYVWVGRRVSHLGQLGLSFELPEDQRYLWDFCLLEAGRSLPIRGQVLQAVIEREKAERVWAAVRPQEAAEFERGGFSAAGQLYRGDGAARLACAVESERSVALAELVGLTPSFAASVKSARTAGVAA